MKKTFIDAELDIKLLSAKEALMMEGSNLHGAEVNDTWFGDGELTEDPTDIIG